MVARGHAMRVAGVVGGLELRVNAGDMPADGRRPSTSTAKKTSYRVSAKSAMRWKRTKSAGLCLVLGTISLCASGFPAASADLRGPVRSLLEMRQESVIVQKSDLSCGAAALATLLNFQFGDRVTEKEVTGGLIRRQEYIEQPELVRVREGFSLLDMKRYAASRGYVGIGYGNLDMADLLKLAPIIVAVSPIGFNHFVVFRGMIGDKVLLADPAFGNRTMSREKFEQMQIDFPEIGKVGFIITRDGKPAPPGQLAVRASDFVAPSGDQTRQVVGF